MTVNSKVKVSPSSDKAACALLGFSYTRGTANSSRGIFTTRHVHFREKESRSALSVSGRASCLHAVVLSSTSSTVCSQLHLSAHFMTHGLIKLTNMW